MLRNFIIELIQFLHRFRSPFIGITSTTLTAEDFLGYKPFSKVLNHKTVNYSAKQYVCDDNHTNTVESFWTILKRGVRG